MVSISTKDTLTVMMLFKICRKSVDRLSFTVSTS